METLTFVAARTGRFEMDYQRYLMKLMDLSDEWIDNGHEVQLRNLTGVNPTKGTQKLGAAEKKNETNSDALDTPGWGRRLQWATLRAWTVSGTFKWEIPDEYTVDVLPMSNVFLRGHRIRVHVTSSNFPL